MRYAGNAAFLQRLFGDGVGDLEGVEAAALHQLNLVAEHFADGADFTGEAMTVAQQAREGKGASVAIFRKRESDHRKALDVLGDRIEPRARFDAYAQRHIRTVERVALLHPPVEGKDDVTGNRRGLAVRQRAPAILDECAVLVEGHVRFRAFV